MIYFNLKELHEDSVKLNNRKPIEAGHNVVNSGGHHTTTINIGNGIVQIIK